MDDRGTRERDDVDGVARRRRRAVLEHGLAERRRVYPALLHVGEPGAHERVVAATGLDDALRVEVLQALLTAVRNGSGPPLVWLTRPGPPDLQDVDAGWTRATVAAGAERGEDADFVVVGRRWWADPRSGTVRRWSRLRGG